MEKGWKERWKEAADRGICLAVLCVVMAGMLFAKGWGSAALHNRAIRGTSQSQEVVGQGEAAWQEQKIAYLTFDDGPSILTPEYLKILKEEKVHATFFLIGQQVEGNLVDVVRQAVKEGHEIGLHTYCHKANEIYSSKESYCEDLRKTKLCLERKLDVEPKLFRFPWGSTNLYVRSYKEGVVEEMKKEGIDYVDWNVSGEDSVGCPSADSILSNVRKDYGKYNDPVILLHDSATCKATLEALRPLIRELKANGYSFQTLSGRENSCHFGE